MHHHSICFAGKFSLVNFHGQKKEELEINDWNLKIEDDDRSEAFVGQVQRLAQRVEQNLPERIHVQLSIAPDIGKNAYDSVVIYDRNNVQHAYRLGRRVNDYSGVDFINSLIPQKIRDWNFCRLIYKEALQFSKTLK